MTLALSATSIIDFLDCSYKWKLKQQDEADIAKEATLGIIVHKVLENYPKISKEIELQKYGLYLLKQFYLDNDLESLDLVNRCIYNFFNIPTKSCLSSNDLVEWTFSIPVAENILFGRIDRIANSLLFDWKTSSKIPYEINKNIQFIIYDFAYEKIFNKPANEVYYVNLNKGISIPYVRDKYIFNEFFQETLPRISKLIKIGIYSREGIYRNKCHKCKFKQVCLGDYKNELARRRFIAE